MIRRLPESTRLYRLLSSTTLFRSVPEVSARRSGYYAYVTRGEAHGIEAAAALTLGALTLDGNYSWIVAEDRSPGATNFGRDLPRRPRRAANASVRYALPFGFDVGAALRWSGTSFDTASNSLEIGRASCRERVCQNVWIWVSAVSLKKQKTT